MFHLRPSLSHRAAAWLLLSLLTPAAAPAGGPKYVAGTSFFNPGGGGPARPLGRRPGELLRRSGPAHGPVSNQQATAMVDAAAALWSAVPTAGVTLTDKGPLNEDVSGANIHGG